MSYVEHFIVGPLSVLAAMTTATTAQALTTKQPGDIVSDMIGSVS